MQIEVHPARPEETEGRLTSGFFFGTCPHEMKLNFQANVDEITSQLAAKFRSRVPIAVAIAMTQTAQDVQAAEVAEMERVFDRPTPWTTNSVRYLPAQHTNLEASVFINDAFVGGGGHPAGEYLIPQIEGGIRQFKRSEWALHQMGYLRADQYIVPGKGVPLDAYGSISGGTMQQILSGIGASETTAGRTSNRPTGTLNARQRRKAATQAKYFVANQHIPQTAHLRPGVYQNLPNDKLAGILYFVDRPTYSPTFDFAGVADETTAERFPIHLSEQLAVSIERAG